jgi:hypothetical protein
MVAKMKLANLIKQLNNSLVALGNVEVKIRRDAFCWDDVLEEKPFVDEEISGVGNDEDSVYIRTGQSEDKGLWI